MDAEVPGGARALRFNIHEYVAFDWLMLQRPGADEGYSQDVLDRARRWHANASESDKARLLANIMAGCRAPMTVRPIPGLRRMLDRYKGIGPAELKANLRRFLELSPNGGGTRHAALHPTEDPPRPVFGLPRVVSNEQDLADILAMVDLPANGITL